MFRRGLAACLVLGVATVAQAGAVIDLVPDNTGPYGGGETVDVEILLKNLDPEHRSLRLVTLDFSQTDPAITLPARFNYDMGLMPPDTYGRFPALPRPSITYMHTTEVPGFMLVLPASGILSLGIVAIALPAAVGTYTLDVLNSAAPDENWGARYDYGFTTRVTEGAFNGGITGGTYDFVVPEPATLVLLALGGVIAAWRRPRRTMRSDG